MFLAIRLIAEIVGAGVIHLVFLFICATRCSPSVTMQKGNLVVVFMHPFPLSIPSELYHQAL